MSRNTAIVCVAAMAALASTPMAGQAPTRGQSASGPVSADRASIEGTWNFSTLTPLERPAEFAGRATMTAAEATAFEKQVMERTNADRRDGSADADVARAYNDAWYDRGTQVATVNGQARTSLIVDPPDGRLPQLTAEAARRLADRAQARRDHPADGPEDRSLAERCLSFNAGPPMLSGPYNNYVQIFVFADYVVVMNEMIHDARVIPTNRRAHLPLNTRRFQGDSIGRWEAKTLVVDTTNFTDRTNFRGASDRMHLVERFTRADADTLLYEFTVEDQTSFTRPWRVQLPMKLTTEPIFEYACHEGNHALEGILRGARFGERSTERR